MIENVQRTDLNPLERAQAIQQLMREFGLSNLEVAQKLEANLLPLLATLFAFLLSQTPLKTVFPAV